MIGDVVKYPGIGFMLGFYSTAIWEPCLDIQVIFRKLCPILYYVLLTIAEPIKIVSQPNHVSCSVGGEIVLEVKASGLPFPRYQWYNSLKEPIASE